MFSPPVPVKIAVIDRVYFLNHQNECVTQYAQLCLLLIRKGFSFIEVLSPCPTTAGRNIFNFKNPSEMYDWYDEQVTVLKPGETESPDGKIGLGILLNDNTKEELTEVQAEKKEAAKK